MAGDRIGAAEYLDLTAGRAKRALDPHAVERIRSFVDGCACGDGGYRGRGASSDLYYTHFAIEVLQLLVGASAENGVARYLESFNTDDSLDLVHHCCLIRAVARVESATTAEARLRRLYDRLERWRRSDGAYRLEEGGRGSVYAGFLALLAYGVTQTVPPRCDALLRWISARRRPDGSWSDEPQASSGTTTVTAAAVIAVVEQGGHTAPETVEWLLARQNGEGGFTASPSSPMADLVSTAAALSALRRVGACDREMAASAAAYISGLWAGNGGFRGFTFDAGEDCEFAYWALLGLGATVEAA